MIDFILKSTASLILLGWNTVWKTSPSERRKKWNMEEKKINKRLFLHFTRDDLSSKDCSMILGIFMNSVQGPVYTTPEEFENTTFFTASVFLPQEVICHENGAFRKRTSNWSGGVWKSRLRVPVWTENILKELYSVSETQSMTCVMLSVS